MKEELEWRGWAPEYVEAMWLMLQQEKPDDFVIATGETHTLQEFVAEIFSSVGLDWLEHVNSDPGLLRPSEIMVSRSNPVRAANALGWRARYKMKDVARMLVIGAKEFNR